MNPDATRIYFTGFVDHLAPRSTPYQNITLLRATVDDMLQLTRPEADNPSPILLHPSIPGVLVDNPIVDDHLPMPATHMRGMAGADNPRPVITNGMRSRVPANSPEAGNQHSTIAPRPDTPPPGRGAPQTIFAFEVIVGDRLESACKVTNTWPDDEYQALHEEYDPTRPMGGDGPLNSRPGSAVDMRGRIVIEWELSDGGPREIDFWDLLETLVVRRRLDWRARLLYLDDVDEHDETNGGYSLNITNGVNGHAETTGRDSSNGMNGVNGHAETTGRDSSNGMNGVNGYAGTTRRNASNGINGVNGHTETTGRNSGDRATEMTTLTGPTRPTRPPRTNGVIRQLTRFAAPHWATRPYEPRRTRRNRRLTRTIQGTERTEASEMADTAEPTGTTSDPEFKPDPEATENTEATPTVQTNGVPGVNGHDQPMIDADRQHAERQLDRWAVEEQGDLLGFENTEAPATTQTRDVAQATGTAPTAETDRYPQGSRRLIAINRMSVRQRVDYFQHRLAEARRTALRNRRRGVRVYNQLMTADERQLANPRLDRIAESELLLGFARPEPMRTHRAREARAANGIPEVNDYDGTEVSETLQDEVQSFDHFWERG